MIEYLRSTPRMVLPESQGIQGVLEIKDTHRHKALR